MVTNEQKEIKKKYTVGVPGNVLDAEYFYFETAPETSQQLAVVLGGYEKCAPDFHINRHSYPYYVIKYTLKGKGIIRIHSKTHQLKAGCISGFCPGVAHQYIADPQEPMEHIFVTFTGSEAEQLMKAASLCETGFIETTNRSLLFSAFENILHKGRSKPPFAQQLCAGYLRLILLEMASGLARTEVKTPISMQTYIRCKKFIDDNFSAITSPIEVADHCNIDIRYMARLFKRHLHMTPQQYIMRLKFNRAAGLLLSTGLSIKQIAAEIGFEDPYHFSRNFKKFHGQSPLIYRQSHL